MRSTLQKIFRSAALVALMVGAALAVAQDSTPQVEMRDLAASVGETVVLRATVSQAGRSLANTRVVFRVNQRLIGAVTTNSSGIAEMPYVVPANLGRPNVELMASLGGSNYVKRTLAVSLPTPDLDIQNLAAARGATTSLVAVLRLPNGLPIRNATVGFRINGVQLGFARTDADGRASLTLRIPASLAVGPYVVEARSRSTSRLAAASSTGTLVIQS